VIEGTSHIFITDAIRHEAQADIAAIRGFRYGHRRAARSDHVGGPLHFIPIGPMIAKGTIKGKQLKAQLENSVDGSLNPTSRNGPAAGCSTTRACAPKSIPMRRPASGEQHPDRQRQDLEAARYGGRLHLRLLLLRTRSGPHQHERRCATSRSSRTRTGATSTASMSSPAISRDCRTAPPRPDGAPEARQAGPHGKLRQPEIQPWRGAVQSTVGSRGRARRTAPHTKFKLMGGPEAMLRTRNITRDARRLYCPVHCGDVRPRRRSRKRRVGALGEAALRQQINEWTVGLAGGLLEGAPIRLAT